MPSGRFGTAINCIDGRVQGPVARYLKRTYLLDYIDIITEPGPDRLLASGPALTIDAIRAKVLISAREHASNVIALTGHFDCAANPADRQEHEIQIRDGVRVIRDWNFTATILGLYVNENWEVEVVA